VSHGHRRKHVDGAADAAPVSHEVDSDWRAPSQYEAELVDRRLAEPFAGRDELLLQWASASVRTIDECGCLSIRPAAGSAPCDTKYRVPVEAESPDGDGSAHALLHVVDGYLNELEFYADARPQVLDRVDLEHLELFAPPWKPS
jgi:hypothetical protein